jgi:hypothetical protein
MAKRFTDSGKWSKAWFMELSSDHKLLWIYMLDSCDHAGIFEVNWPLTSFMTGLQLTSIPEPFNKQVLRIDKKRYFIRDFVEFQYGPLNEKVAVHRSVISILKKNSINISTLKQPLNKGYSGVKDKDKDMDKVKDKEKDRSLKSITLELRQEWAKKHIWEDVDVEEEFTKFSDYLLQSGKKYKDYQAGFRNWLKQPWVPRKIEDQYERILREKGLKK